MLLVLLLVSNRWSHVVVFLSPEQATGSAGVTPQRPAPTLHEPCLDERSLGERERGGWLSHPISLTCYSNILAVCHTMALGAGQPDLPQNIALIAFIPSQCLMDL